MPPSRNPCCRICPHGSSSQSGLTRHRLKCHLYQQFMDAGVRQARHTEQHRSIISRETNLSPARQHHDEVEDSETVTNTEHIQTDTTSHSTPPSDVNMPDAEGPSLLAPQGSPLQPPLPHSMSLTSGHPQRSQRLPARYRDMLPEPPRPATSTVEVTGATSIVPRISLVVRNPFRTPKNSFGLWKQYMYRPSYDPDAFISPDDLYLPHPSSVVPQAEVDEMQVEDSVSALYSSKTVELLLDWQNTGSSAKSNEEVNRLVHSVLLHPSFELDALKTFNATRENQKADAAEERSPFLRSFKHADLDIRVPSGSEGVPPRSFTIPGLYYRQITTLITEAFDSQISEQFHLTPFKLFRSRTLPGGEESDNERVYSEMYNSDAFLDEHDRVQRAPTDDRSCKREKVVASLMFWSDATHLAAFGTAKLWPIYMLFGNLSKYIRCQPNSGAIKHVAYIPSFPDSLQDQLKKFHLKWDTQQTSILAHCRRELMHAVWRFLLDEDFLHAYKFGMVLRCQDGFERRIYPRLFTYSADYPEKVLLATIRDQGVCPCPRCLIPKSKLDRLGLIADSKNCIKKARKYDADRVNLARKVIYELGKPIGGVLVERLLKATSAVPTSNAFMDKLGPTFDVSRMLVVDFMHEFELGVWKALFVHLIRVLYAAAPGASRVADLDKRFREIPQFSQTIRKFTNNVSEMKKLAARDYEDILQCSIPAFEGLLDEPYNKCVMKLLYRTAEWHALAKLRMHTDATLDHLESLTKQFGRLMRQFRDLTKSNFQTVELPRELAARIRQQQRVQGKAFKQTTQRSSTRKKKELNLFTPKFHSLGDYIQTIRMFGSTDSFSTQIGELAHRLVKQLYGRTNKRNATMQIGKRIRRLERAQHAAKYQRLKCPSEMPATNLRLDARYEVPISRNNSVNIYNFLRTHNGDPAITGFLPKLKDNILGRLLKRDYEGDSYGEFTDEERNTVRVSGERIHQCNTLRVNYTTYDIRRDTDTIKLSSYPDIMVKSPESGPDAQPFWYARVIGVFHALVSSSHPGVREKSTIQRLDFLWVRWFGVEPGRYRYGIRCARLPKIGFVESTDPYAFTFLDPAHVIRGVHLIPAFTEGHTSALLPTSKSVARILNPEDKTDWTNFYVNIFVDRDMFMRHFGLGVGHLQYERQHEIELDDTIMDQMLEEDSDESNSDSDDIDAGDLDNAVVGLDEEEEEVRSRGSDDDISISDSDSDHDSDSDSDVREYVNY